MRLCQRLRRIASGQYEDVPAIGAEQPVRLCDLIVKESAISIYICDARLLSLLLEGCPATHGPVKTQGRVSARAPLAALRRHGSVVGAKERYHAQGTHRRRWLP